ncbi:MAG: hypothetical protein L0G25_07125 [Psychrobacter sp.]|nr:hypothetical protein [Psychrobacter sp.]
MPELLPTDSDISKKVDELACYEQTDAESVAVLAMTTLEDNCYLRQSCYRLPSGTLRLLNSTLHLPAAASKSAIEGARQAVIKSALTWQKRCVQKDKQGEQSYCVLILDIRLDDALTNTFRADKKSSQQVSHSFGARYFMEELVLDISETNSVLQVFSWQDWQAVLATLKTSCDLWRFLSYHIEQLQDSVTRGIATFDSEKQLLKQFRNSAKLFAQAINIDNAVINYAIQDKPNAALITMSLAQKQGSMTAQMYQQHMQQAAMLWSQLSTQMIELTYEKLEGSNNVKATSLKASNGDQVTAISAKQWQQQLLGESLFSRHELVRTIYKHPKQSAMMIEQGYVVHQHSYESLGRHYVLIFYGQGAKAQQSRQKIQPNLAKIAQEVATRLPLEELHHVIVMGIDFIGDDESTFVDMDLWIQPIVAMTAKERQLTKQLQQLSQQQKPKQTIEKTSQVEPKSTANLKLPSLTLNLTIPANTLKN